MADNPEFPIEVETRGMAHVGQLLSFSLLAYLCRSGRLSDAEGQMVLDTTLLQVEGLQTSYPHDASLQHARVALEAMSKSLGR